MDADERIDEVNQEKLRALFPGVRDQKSEEVSHGLHGRHGLESSAPSVPSLVENSSSDSRPLTTNQSPSTNVAYVMKCLSVQPDTTQRGTVVDHVRLFPNRPDIRWKYRVHEQILPALRATGAEIIFTDIVIQHTGYVDPAFTRQKLERNLRLLHLDHMDHPQDPYILFHLGWGHLELGRVPEAIAFLQASLNGSQSGDSIVKKIFALLAQAHHRLWQRNEALAACRAGRARYPEDPELLYREGIFHRERRNWPAAERSLRALVQREESNHGEHRDHREKNDEATQSSPLASAPSAFSAVKNSSFGSADVGLTGYLARHQLALLYYQQGRWAEAETEWNISLSDRPTHLDALKGLGEMYLKQGRWPELDEVVQKLVDEKTNNRESHESHEYEGRILQARGMLARMEFEAARSVAGRFQKEWPGRAEPAKGGIEMTSAFTIECRRSSARWESSSGTPCSNEIRVGTAVLSRPARMPWAALNRTEASESLSNFFTLRRCCDVPAHPTNIAPAARWAGVLECKAATTAGSTLPAETPRRVNVPNASSSTVESSMKGKKSINTWTAPSGCRTCRRRTAAHNRSDIVSL
jgi:tetratricopeptide (TPR) repeat protein